VSFWASINCLNRLNINEFTVETAIKGNKVKTLIISATAYPLNFIPVPKEQGISKGYLRPADGIVQFGIATEGADRGGINWDGSYYRVMGSKLIKIASNVKPLQEFPNGIQYVRSISRLDPPSLRIIAEPRELPLRIPSGISLNESNRLTQVPSTFQMPDDMPVAYCLHGLEFWAISFLQKSFYLSNET